VAAYDEVADAYSRALDPNGDDPVLTELVGDVAGREVLALACGQGRDARLLAGLGAGVTGVDVSEEMLRHARELEAGDPRGIAFVQGDAEELPCADESFDGVVCHMALMDIAGLAPTIASVARVLRDGGWFVFSIVHPCYGGHVQIVSDYLQEHRYAKRVPPEWLPSHAYHRPLGMYVDELVAAGFRLERLVEVHHPAVDQSGVPGLLYARAVRIAATATTNGTAIQSD
jgi:ubiquinone/menaquinone biosynthesis C-methylase UbiE